MQQLSGAQTEESWVFNLPLQFCLLLSMNRISGRDIHGTPLLTSMYFMLFLPSLPPLFSLQLNQEFSIELLKVTYAHRVFSRWSFPQKMCPISIINSFPID